MRKRKYFNEILTEIAGFALVILLVCALMGPSFNKFSSDVVYAFKTSEVGQLVDVIGNLSNKGSRYTKSSGLSDMKLSDNYMFDEVKNLFFGNK